MRACLPSVLAVLLVLAVSPGAVRADAVKVTPEMTIFTSEQATAGAGRPNVLRGSATRRGTIRGGLDNFPAPLVVDAGDTLWLTDPLTGAVVACQPRRTSRVGSRFIDCFGDRLPSSSYD